VAGSLAPGDGNPQNRQKGGPKPPKRGGPKPQFSGLFGKFRENPDFGGKTRFSGLFGENPMLCGGQKGVPPVRPPPLFGVKVGLLSSGNLDPQIPDSGKPPEIGISGTPTPDNLSGIGKNPDFGGVKFGC
jgi:hypothetical protein